MCVSGAKDRDLHYFDNKRLLLHCGMIAGPDIATA
jgi:hypothetical protein